MLRRNTLRSKPQRRRSKSRRKASQSRRGLHTFKFTGWRFGGQTSYTTQTPNIPSRYCDIAGTEAELLAVKGFLFEAWLSLLGARPWRCLLERARGMSPTKAASEKWQLCSGCVLFKCFVFLPHRTTQPATNFPAPCASSESPWFKWRPESPCFAKMSWPLRRPVKGWSQLSSGTLL